MQKFYDSDGEQEEKMKKRKSLANTSQEILNADEFLEHLNEFPTSVKTCENLYFYEYEINTDSLVALFQKCGKSVKRLSFGTISLQLLRHVQELCPKLESLTIRASTQDIKYPYKMSSSNGLSTRRTYPQLNKLLNLHLESNNFLSNQDDFAHLLKSCKNLESLFYDFQTTEELTQALTLLNDNLCMSSLKTLRLTVGKGNEHEGELVLQHSHIMQVISLSQKAKVLENLELISGIWEDVTADDLQTLMLSFSKTLKQFKIAGNLHGIDIHDKQLTVTVPKLDRLVSFSLGSSYEFEEIIEDLHNRTAGASTSSFVPRNNVVSLTEKHLVSFIVTFPHIMPNLEELCLGNLIEIDKIHPRTFPRLQVFKIGSAWNRSIDIPSDESVRRFPIFPLVRELQLPDCLKDEFLVQRVRKLFPRVRKVWINLPSVKCLRYFFDAMSGSDVDELHLKTQFDFHGILESALLATPLMQISEQPTPSTSARVQDTTPPNLKQLMALKNPADGDKVYNEFIRYHNIELPLSNDDEILQTSRGIGSLNSLRILELEHIPRKLRIPLRSDIPHYHHLQRFHPHLTIGFLKYPLSKQFFSSELQQLHALEKFGLSKNFDVSICFCFLFSAINK